MPKLAIREKGKPTKKKMDELTPDEINFLYLCIAENSATNAYLKCYPKCKNRDTARTESAKLKTSILAKPCSQKYIDDFTAEMTKPSIASAEEVLTFMSAVMRGEVKDQFGLETTVADRLKATEMLAKKYTMFLQKVEVKGDIGLATVLAKARKRAITQSEAQSEAQEPPENDEKSSQQDV